MNPYIQKLLQAGSTHTDAAKEVVENVTNGADLEQAVTLLNEEIKILEHKRHELRMSKLRALARDYVAGKFDRKFAADTSGVGA